MHIFSYEDIARFDGKSQNGEVLNLSANEARPVRGIGDQHVRMSRHHVLDHGLRDGWVLRDPSRDGNTTLNRLAGGIEQDLPEGRRPHEAARPYGTLRAMRELECVRLRWSTGSLQAHRLTRSRIARKSERKGAATRCSRRSARGGNVIRKRHWYPFLG